MNFGDHDNPSPGRRSPNSHRSSYKGSFRSNPPEPLHSRQPSNGTQRSARNDRNSPQTKKAAAPQGVPRGVRGPPFVPARDSLLWLLRNHEYSDLVAIVGPEKRRYQLHQSIMCTKSLFFAVSCNYLMKMNPKTPEVDVPEILPPVFDIVLDWIYGNVLALERHQSLILAIYRAANYLNIHSFKLQIARQVGRLLKHNRRNGTPISFDGFQVVRGMFEFASSSEYFSSLRKCADELALSRNIPYELVHLEKVREGEGSNGNTMFWVALAQSYQKALNATVCSECRQDVSTKRGARQNRMCCHCDSEVSVGSPPRGRVRMERVGKGKN
ncbi:hypothetical protein ABW19_dt0209402 [Dactylella cylindrospora]|nr:hypothetical protein ABW19_dt0209402 [Dactylella cylindrospora]